MTQSSATIANFVEDIGLSDADFRRVGQAVYQHCGITLNESKIDLVKARLAKEVRLGRFSSPTEYLNHVLAAPESPAFTSFIDALSTNLTSFFRERDHFDYLTGDLLPRLIAEKRKTGDGKLLVWSAACSSGEEPYTLAMTISELLRDQPRQGAPIEVRILASDISTRVLQIAQAGVYSAARLKDVPPEFRQRYFQEVDSAPSSRRGSRAATSAAPSYSASPEIRAMIRFRHLNLIEAWPFKGPFDVIFCRNVMIYFDRPTQERLVQRFYDILRPNGMLFTGHSESLTGIHHQFVNKKPSIYEKA